ncbi:STAS domain-containing protein [Streptomyces pactum]|uniref:Anti-sigma factor antagonist n=1 Tax=Streptomyces pactum TaxID=68249 RepID=A0ABS0NP20_9ACTN|nr:STAS domain-containing protein [Streptomyces pactum]MBH5336942.1 STAS domain-containing protein [Streptomyces pactum]
MVKEETAFGIRQRTLGGITLVEMAGELDIVAAGTARPCLDALVRGGRHPDIVLDLRGVTFVDCAGLSVLCRVRNRVLERGGRLRLVIDDPRLRRLLKIVRLDDAFEVLDDLASAA